MGNRKHTTLGSALESVGQITSPLWVSVSSSVKWAVQLDK